MPQEKLFEFVVIRKNFTFSTCPACEGTSIRKRTFRKMTFVEDCPVCHGEGRKRFTTNEEVPLAEALKSINQSL